MFVRLVVRLYLVRVIPEKKEIFNVKEYKHIYIKVQIQVQSGHIED